MAEAFFLPPEAATFIARLAYKVSRFPDMIEIVKMIAKEHNELNMEQRKLLIAAYKHTFGPKLRALRFISVLGQGEDDPNRMECIEFYREVLEDDMQAECIDAIYTVEKHLLPFCDDPTNATLYHKMISDARWILATLKDENKEHILKAFTAFETASKKANNLSPANPLRLSLHLTEMAFYNDVMKWSARWNLEDDWILSAHDRAKQALEEARPVLDLLDEKSHQEGTKVIRLIEENLKMWTTSKGKETDTFMMPVFTFVDLEEAWLEIETPPSSSTGCPYPVVSPSVPAVAPDIFITPGDWGYDVHEDLPPIEVRRRRKAAQMKKGRMG